MKTFFIECIVNYTDYCLESEPEHCTESYSYIISAKTKNAAEKRARIMAAEQCDEELNFGEIANIRIEIEQSYETDEGARL